MEKWENWNVQETGTEVRPSYAPKLKRCLLGSLAVMTLILSGCKSEQEAVTTSSKPKVEQREDRFERASREMDEKSAERREAERIAQEHGLDTSGGISYRKEGGVITSVEAQGKTVAVEPQGKESKRQVEAARDLKNKLSVDTPEAVDDEVKPEFKVNPDIHKFL